MTTFVVCMIAVVAVGIWVWRSRRPRVVLERWLSPRSVIGIVTKPPSFEPSELETGLARAFAGAGIRTIFVPRNEPLPAVGIALEISPRVATELLNDPSCDEGLEECPVFREAVECRIRFTIFDSSFRPHVVGHVERVVWCEASVPSTPLDEHDPRLAPTFTELVRGVVERLHVMSLGSFVVLAYGGPHEPIDS